MCALVAFGVEVSKRDERACNYVRDHSVVRLTHKLHLASYVRSVVHVYRSVPPAKCLSTSLLVNLIRIFGTKFLLPHFKMFFCQLHRHEAYKPLFFMVTTR